jgi:hypothetical protein
MQVSCVLDPFFQIMGKGSSFPFKEAMAWLLQNCKLHENTKADQQFGYYKN